jgi:cell division septation protein DedD
VVAVAAPGWWGDAWLHAAVRQRMTDAVREAKTVQEACDRLARPALAHKAWVLVVLLELAALLAWRLGGPWGDPPPPPRPEPLVGEAVPAPAPPPPPSPSPSPSPAPAPEPQPEPATPPSPPAEPPPSPAPSPAAAPAPAPAPDDNAAPRPRLGGHGVSVGIFADPANAERVAKRLRDAGLPVVSDPLESARGTLTRVRVGPLDSAEAVRNLGLEARPYGPR